MCGLGAIPKVGNLSLRLEGLGDCLVQPLCGGIVSHGGAAHLGNGCIVFYDSAFHRGETSNAERFSDLFAVLLKVGSCGGSVLVDQLCVISTAMASGII